MDRNPLFARGFYAARLTLVDVEIAEEVRAIEVMGV